MPPQSQTLVDVCVVTRLHATSGTVTLGTKSANPQAYAAILGDPLQASLTSKVTRMNMPLAHASALPSESECRELALGLLPKNEALGLSESSVFDEIHRITPTGWIPGHGFSYAFQLKKNESTLKRALTVNGRSVTLDYLVVVQPNA